VACQVPWNGYLYDGAHEVAVGRERPSGEGVRREAPRVRHPEGGDGKKVVRPSSRREMAKTAVQAKGISIRLV
jgi:hypothetical protein